MFSFKAKAAERPRSKPSQSESFIGSDYYLMGNTSSTPISNYRRLPLAYPMSGMKTIAEIRRLRLEQLIEKHGSIAALNEALGRPRNHSKVSQLRNANIRRDRGKAVQIGDAAAREFEALLSLEPGWMDNLPFNEDPTIDDRLRHLHHVAESLAPYQVDQLIKIGATLAEPAPSRNGTEP